MLKSSSGNKPAVYGALTVNRLEAEKFAWPRDDEASTQMIGSQDFEWLLEGFDLWAD